MSLNRASQPTEIMPASTAAPTPALDRTLEWQLHRACRTVARPAHGCPGVGDELDAGEHGPDELWRAVNAHAAALSWSYGVEVLLVQEGGQLRMVVERPETAATAGPSAAGAGERLVPTSPGFLARLRALLARSCRQV